MNDQIKEALDSIKKRYETGAYKIINIETMNDNCAHRISSVTRLCVDCDFNPER